MFSNLHERIPQYIRYHKKDFLAFSIAFAFFIVFSIFSILQYYSLGTSAFDLGINAQSLFVFIHEGIFYSPMLGENTLVQHFSIFKFTQVPVYYLFPSPISIMIYEDLFIVMGGLHSISALDGTIERPYKISEITLSCINWFLLSL